MAQEKEIEKLKKLLKKEGLEESVKKAVEKRIGIIEGNKTVTK